MSEVTIVRVARMEYLYPVTVGVYRDPEQALNSARKLGRSLALKHKDQGRRVTLFTELDEQKRPAAIVVRADRQVVASYELERATLEEAAGG